MTTPGTRLARAIQAAGLSKAEFARRMDVPPQAVRNWINRGLPAEHAFQAGRILGKNPEWLVSDAKVPEQYGAKGEDAVVIDGFASLSPTRKRLLFELVKELSSKR